MWPPHQAVHPPEGQRRGGGLLLMTMRRRRNKKVEMMIMDRNCGFLGRRPSMANLNFFLYVNFEQF
jgi:hypothetical protein